MKVQFTEEEQKYLQRKVYSVWDEVAYDMLQATAEEKGKDINSVTVRRSIAIEVSLDAGRPEELIKRDIAAGRVTQDLLDRFNALDYKARLNLVKPAFTFTHYGL